MEGQDGQMAINIESNSIETAQDAVGRLDVHVCGECHTVFHFVEQFVEHKTKENACDKKSHFRENSNNEQKAQVWAFLLWKDSQIRQEGAERDAATSWDLYQQWCKMEDNIRNSWVSAGKTIQAFTKLSNAKIPDSPRSQSSTQQSPSTPSTPNELTKQTTIIRKVMRNGQPEDIEIKKESKADSTNQNDANKKPIRPRCVVVPKYKPGTSPTDNEPENTQEYAVEKITAKRYNIKKKCAEFLLKWEGFGQDHNTWETQEVVDTCKYLIEEFERNLAKQKEMKALREKQLQQQQQQQQQQSGKKIIRQVVQQSPVIKQEVNKPGPSTSEIQQQHRGPGRPPRSSKTKAMDQVKVWCGSMKDEENDLLGKRRVDDTDSDSEDTIVAKRIKANTHSDDDWTGESEEEKTGRSDAIQRAFKAATNGSNNKTTSGTTTTTMVTTTDLSNLINAQTGTIIQQSPLVVTNQKGVKLDGNKLPQLTSGVYMMHRKDGMIKLESSPGGKINVKNPQNSGVLMVQNRDGTTLVRKQVIGTSSSAAANSITPVKVVSKSDGTQVVTPMKYIPKTGTPRPHQITAQQQQQQRIITQQKNEPVKIQPKPEIGQVQQLQIVTAVQSPVQIQTRMSTTPTIRQNNPQIQRTTPDGRQIVQRQAIRGQTPTTPVIGNTRTTTVRPPLTKQQQSSPMQRQQILQKRIITTTTTTTTSSPGGATATSPQVVKETVMSPNQTGQPRPKFTIVSSSSAAAAAGQMVKQQQTPTTSVTTITKQGQKLTPKTTLQQTQSLLSPQQKLLMAKRKAQAEAANASKMSPKNITTQNKIITTTPTVVATTGATRGRGRPPLTPQQPQQQQIISTATTILPVVAKQKETKIVESDGIHMEFHEVGGTDDENDDNDTSKIQAVDVQISIPDTNNQMQPDSPQPQYTLCPLTGRIIGPDGEPMETSDNTTIVITQEPLQSATAVATTTTTIAESTDSTTLVDTKSSSLSLPTIDTTPSMPIIQTDVPATTPISIQPVVTTQSSSSSSSTTTAQIVLPSLDGSSDNGTIMRVEMSPGTFLQSSNDATPMDISVGQDLPCLDDTVSTTADEILPTITTTSTTVNDTINKTIDTIPITTTTAAAVVVTSAVAAATTTTTATTNDNVNNDVGGDKDTQKTNDDDNNSATTTTSVVGDDGSNLVTITGEDGVVYQVAGQAADGQTLLVTRGADGEQQCVYVTTEQQGGEGGVLTLDHAVAEAVAQLMPDGQVGLAPQFYVKEGDDGSNSEQVVMSIMDTSGQPGQEDPDSQAQVVAQVVQADEPTPGGTRRVVLLLPDGNLMMTEVDEEQYAALDLDK